ncbi:hypothetical protein BJV77DRAFT_514220 [Russula vinacea]|nr:hypothetical protein BJV77DRAFT_514220 [Russula vinacea]
MPRCRSPLAELAMYLAKAPKSTRAYEGYFCAEGFVKRDPTLLVGHLQAFTTLDLTAATSRLLQYYFRAVKDMQQDGPPSFHISTQTCSSR